MSPRSRIAVCVLVGCTATILAVYALIPASMSGRGVSIGRSLVVGAGTMTSLACLAAMARRHSPLLRASYGALGGLVAIVALEATVYLSAVANPPWPVVIVLTSIALSMASARGWPVATFWLVLIGASVLHGSLTGLPAASPFLANWQAMFAIAVPVGAILAGLAWTHERSTDLTANGTSSQLVPVICLLGLAAAVITAHQLGDDLPPESILRMLRASPWAAPHAALTAALAVAATSSAVVTGRPEPLGVVLTMMVYGVGLSIAMGWTGWVALSASQSLFGVPYFGIPSAPNAGTALAASLIFPAMALVAAVRRRTADLLLWCAITAYATLAALVVVLTHEGVWSSRLLPGNPVEVAVACVVIGILVARRHPRLNAGITLLSVTVTGLAVVGIVVEAGLTGSDLGTLLVVAGTALVVVQALANRRLVVARPVIVVSLLLLCWLALQLNTFSFGRYSLLFTGPPVVFAAVAVVVAQASALARTPAPPRPPRSPLPAPSGTGQ